MLLSLVDGERQRIVMLLDGRHLVGTCERTVRTRIYVPHAQPEDGLERVWVQSAVLQPENSICQSGKRRVVRYEDKRLPQLPAQANNFMMKGFGGIYI